jgi:hypothetical protein
MFQGNVEQYWQLYDLAANMGKVPSIDNLILGYVSRQFHKNQEITDMFLNKISTELENEQSLLFRSIEHLLVEFTKKNAEIRTELAEYANMGNLKKSDIKALFRLCKNDQDLHPMILEAVIEELMLNPYFLADYRFVLLKEIMQNDFQGDINAFLQQMQMDRSSLLNGMFEEYLFLLKNRDNFYSGVRTVFLPHHGTNTQNSQRILGFFTGTSGVESTPTNDRIFIVSSAPFAGQRIPKRSTLEMTPDLPIQRDHPFLYAKDDIDLEVDDAVALQVTTKPIYLTSASPIGVFCLKNIGNDTLILDPYFRAEDQDHSCRWVNALSQLIIPIN